MAEFFESLQNILSALGASVVLPIIIFILGIVLGAKAGKAFRSGLTVGIAFIGIGLVIGLMWNSLSTVSQAIVTKTGVKLDAVDVGWPTAAAIAFGSNVGTFIIPLSIAVNLILLWLGFTRTLNVDVWNFWHFAFVGSLVFVMTNNIALGLAAAAVAAALALFFADWTAKAIQQFYGIPGISITTASAQSFVPFVIPINWLLERIPGVRDWKADPDSIQKRFGVLGEPIVIGVIIGFVLGLIAYLPPGEGSTWTSAIVGVLSTSVNLGAVMLLLPRMVAILMEGLIPISEAAREFMSKRASGKEIYIGLDAAILIGHPSAIATGLLLVPITILLAIILPGNRMMPFADLAAIPFFVCMFAPLTRGNVVRMTILGTLSAIAGLYMASWMAPIQTAAARMANIGIPEGATLITNMGDGWTASAFYLTFPAQLGGSIAQWIWLALCLVAIIIAFIAFAKNEEKWSRLAGVQPEN